MNILRKKCALSTEHKEIMMLTPRNNRESFPTPSEKTVGRGGSRLPVTAGTMLFFAVCLILIAGLCQFSFYVLKNHRSAVVRDDFIKTYVDVQPYAGPAAKSAPSYIALNAPGTDAPAVFYAPEKESAPRKVPAAETFLPPAPVPDYAEKRFTGRRFAAAPVPAERRAPVPEKPILTAAVRLTPPAPVPAEEAVSIDDLISSGTTLLNEADDSLLSTETVFEEPAPVLPAPLPAAASPKAEEIRIAAAEPVKKEAPRPVKTRKTEEKTRWIDIAALRRALEETPPAPAVIPPSKPEDASAAALPERQFASLNHAELSDADTDSLKSAAVPTVSVPPASDKPADRPAQDIKSAVVQEVPFSGTETKKAEAAPPAGKAPARTEAEPSYESPWKIAAVNGKAKNPLAVIKPETKATIKNIAKDETPPEEYMEVRNGTPAGDKGQAVIYRNGKVHKIYQLDGHENEEQKQAGEKSLNWMDRQQAAVWTSMSQSDAPSVWTASSNEKSHNSEAAKAFKVADVTEEKPSEDVITSAQVRVVGEEKKPEAKKDPLLLPLGPASPTSIAPLTLPSPTAPSAVLPPGANLKTTSDPTPEAFKASDTASDAAAQGDDGLVNKIFSLFGKTDTPSGMPSIGAGSAESSTPDLNRKTETKKAVSKKSSTPKDNEKSTKTSKASPSRDDILPTELRLTFKPGSAEISTQSVKWIKAFGQRAKKDIQSAVEVRMSARDQDIQEKRFALIRSALIGAGMEDEQIVPVLTDRTPHTIVLRLYDRPEEGYEEYTSSGSGVEERMYYRQW